MFEKDKRYKIINKNPRAKNTVSLIEEFKKKNTDMKRYKTKRKIPRSGWMAVTSVTATVCWSVPRSRSI